MIFYFRYILIIIFSFSLCHPSCLYINAFPKSLIIYLCKAAVSLKRPVTTSLFSWSLGAEIHPQRFRLSLYLTKSSLWKRHLSLSKHLQLNDNWLCRRYESRVMKTESKGRNTEFYLFLVLIYPRDISNFKFFCAFPLYFPSGVYL